MFQLMAEPHVFCDKTASAGTDYFESGLENMAPKIFLQNSSPPPTDSTTSENEKETPMATEDPVPERSTICEPELILVPGEPEYLDPNFQPFSNRSYSRKRKQAHQVRDWSGIVVDLDEEDDDEEITVLGHLQNGERTFLQHNLWANPTAFNAAPRGGSRGQAEDFEEVVLLSDDESTMSAAESRNEEIRNRTRGNSASDDEDVVIIYEEEEPQGQQLEDTQVEESREEMQVDESPEEMQVDEAPEELQVDVSPEELQGDEAPEETRVEPSPEEVQFDESPEETQVAASAEHESADVSDTDQHLITSRVVSDCKHPQKNSSMVSSHHSQTNTSFNVEMLKKTCSETPAHLKNVGSIHSYKRKNHSRVGNIFPGPHVYSLANVKMETLDDPTAETNENLSLFDNGEPELSFNYQQGTSYKMPSVGIVYGFSDVSVKREPPENCDTENTEQPIYFDIAAAKRTLLQKMLGDSMDENQKDNVHVDGYVSEQPINYGHFQDTSCGRDFVSIGKKLAENLFSETGEKHVNFDIFAAKQTLTQKMKSLKDWENLSQHETCTENAPRLQLTCNSCLKLVCSKYALIKHVFTHLDGLEPPEDICNLCGEVFDNSDQLVSHFSSTQGQCYEIASAAEMFCSSLMKQFSCDICRKMFGTRKELVEHFVEHAKTPREKEMFVVMLQSCENDPAVNKLVNNILHEEDGNTARVCNPISEEVRLCTSNPKKQAETPLSSVKRKPARKQNMKKVSNTTNEALGSKGDCRTTGTSVPMHEDPVKASEKYEGQSYGVATSPKKRPKNSIKMRNRTVTVNKKTCDSQRHLCPFECGFLTGHLKNLREHIYSHLGGSAKLKKKRPNSSAKRPRSSPKKQKEQCSEPVSVTEKLKDGSAEGGRNIHPKSCTCVPLRKESHICTDVSKEKMEEATSSPRKELELQIEQQMPGWSVPEHVWSELMDDLTLQKEGGSKSSDKESVRTKIPTLLAKCKKRRNVPANSVKRKQVLLKRKRAALKRKRENLQAKQKKRNSLPTEVYWDKLMTEKNTLKEEVHATDSTHEPTREEDPEKKPETATTSPKRKPKKPLEKQKTAVDIASKRQSAPAKLCIKDRVFCPFNCGVKLVFCHLKRHIRIHTGECPYKCEICGKGFYRSDVLQVHRSKHSGVPRYKCKICGCGFYWECHLKRHHRVKHPGKSFGH